VRLGVEAPAELPIHREEVFLRIQEENLAAAAAKPDDLSLAMELVAGKAAVERK
jgi:carbon storage regulator